MFFGYPATTASGFFGKIPNFGKAISPFPWGKGCGNGCGFGKVPYGKGFGWPASTFGGFAGSIPATTIATSPW